MMIIDCPSNTDKRIGPAPDGQLEGVFLREFLTGRRKHGWINHHGQHTFRLPFDDATLRRHIQWAIDSAAVYGGAIEQVTLNWETFPAGSSWDAPEPFRFDDAFVLARTIEFIRDHLDGVRIDVYGLMPWTMHRSAIDPARLWEIYYGCGVRPDSLIVSAIGLPVGRTAELIDGKLDDLSRFAPGADLSVITNGSNKSQSELIAKYQIPEIRWYPADLTATKGAA